MKIKMLFSIVIVGLLGLVIPQTSKADFIVMPIEVIKTEEVCTGISVGAKIFELDISHSSEYLSIGDVFSTTSGKLVQITGLRTPYDQLGVTYLKDGDFLLAPKSLPAVTQGVKGPFYYLYGGDLVFAKYL